MIFHTSTLECEISNHLCKMFLSSCMHRYVYIFAFSTYYVSSNPIFIICSDRYYLRHTVMSSFCPTCGNALLVKLPKCYFVCRTCPYTFQIKSDITFPLELKKKKVDDVLGGEKAWESGDKTESTYTFLAAFLFLHFWSLVCGALKHPPLRTSYHHYCIAFPLFLSAVECPKCQGQWAYFMQVQTRSADEVRPRRSRFLSLLLCVLCMENKDYLLRIVLAWLQQLHILYCFFNSFPPCLSSHHSPSPPPPLAQPMTTFYKCADINNCGFRWKEN